MVREICEAKINPKSPLKKRVRIIRGGGNYASKYGIISFHYHDITTSNFFNFLSLKVQKRAEIVR